MKTRLNQFALLLSFLTCSSACLTLPASADSTASLVLTLKCPDEYIVNIWKRRGSGELLYRSVGPLGSLSLGRGDIYNTGSAQVYKFKNGLYTYQVLGGGGDHQGQGTLEVFRNGRSILAESCTREGG
ncbi:hypothetical protein NIES2135_63800 (plasmid) [Leptolyngbya boryana NIES-2135]|jgi:hypothetical protein|uniref:C-type lysozyme inhibitor domain-containing protein n=1 Tax=Leptolyngbya boryana NIES-2135 TaxID=1973484 RepID=A0A1Z4JS59_LEPBY|nr:MULTISPECIES: hypothetical protein [Leptolyngbya]BAY59503.1 hypothetical protein NIES2135_63800 [Leptolyngbya boryana NIES-2135]MBD2373083.1 hypothetical protein [Leptolyngbya sp. FACHB-238]MBD2397162.1 hypothetical protein [Leptolyngbya sp. FACHB-239]MBD2404032.1 hypothetical protein [Leptolyngbya sp. FACHB-402]ULP33323.1 hypothetical protein MCP04_31660 [Leptolyngbya boryana IU 594]